MALGYYGKVEPEKRYEIWNGVQVIKEPSSTYHEGSLSNVYHYIISHVRQHDLGKVYMSNTGVYLNPDSSDFVMPDLSFVVHNRISIVKPNGIFGAPDLTVEITSPGKQNRKRDTQDKFQLYEKFGVQEYWLVDYAERQINIYCLTAGRYVLASHSRVMKGIHLPLDQIFGI